jgi:hypothetical protein
MTPPAYFNRVAASARKPWEPLDAGRIRLHQSHFILKETTSNLGTAMS